MRPPDSETPETPGSHADDFRALVESALELILVIRDGKVIYANATAQKTLGYTPAEIVGYDATLFAHPDDRAAVGARWRKALTGAAMPPSTRRLIRRDGSVLWIEGAVLTARFDGAPAVVLLGRDLTEQRRAEAEQQRADAIATIGALMAGLAPELRNPMFSITSTVEAFEKNMGGSPAAQDLGRVVRYEMGRLSVLLSKLIELGGSARSAAPDSRLDEIVGAVLQKIVEPRGDDAVPSDQSGSKGKPT